MQPAGPNDPSVLSHWREAGEWWLGEPAREGTVWVDAQGVRREVIQPLSALVDVHDRVHQPYSEDHREEWSLRVRKIRDEKVKKASGTIDESVQSVRERAMLTRGRSYREAPKGSIVIGNVRDRAEAALPSVPNRIGATGHDYVLCHVKSGYSFGRSPILAEEIPVHAARLGIGTVLLADRFALTGAAEFTKICAKVGVRPLIGASFEMPEGGEIVLVARSRMGYRNLSRLITECHLEEPRLFPLCTWERLAKHSADLLCLTGGNGGPIDRLLMGRHVAEAHAMLQRLIDLYGRHHTFVQVERSFQPWGIHVEHQLDVLSTDLGLTQIAGGPVVLASSEQLPAQDVLVCADTLCLVEEIVGRKPQRDPAQPPGTAVPVRELNAERVMRSPTETYALFADRPELITNTHRIADICDPDILPGLAPMPSLFPDDHQALTELVWAGAHERYRQLTRPRKSRIERELARIQSLGFARHFLIAWDFCEWARDRGIQFSGRGSVVDSAVSYCLGFSRIDAIEHHLHFDRFLPADGTKRPDIDIDFEAAYRNDIRQYMARKYGDDHVATVAAIGAYCSRGIVREVGKVMGLPDETIAFLSKRLHGGVSPDRLEAALEGRPELRGSHIPKEKFRWVFKLAQQLMDVPRNIRAHSSGVIVSSEPIRDYVPVMRSGDEDVKIIQWDKRSAKRSFDKFDILCLRGNDVLSGTQQGVRAGGNTDFDVQNLPLDDPETYRAFRSGALIGIPQSASPAMRQAHIRLRTENLTDASLVQAGIRPGVGGAVKINELIARRRGKPYSFSTPALEQILGSTYGIIVFQEQVDQLLQYFAQCSSGEAEEIRESIHKRRREGYAQSVRDQIIERIMANGCERHIAVEVCDLICGFEGYGFAQGHALAFAEISIRSVYCQQNFPAEYFASLLNAQPAGYYGPCTIANEARNRGVKMLGPDVNRSELRFQVEDVISDQDPKLVVPNGGIRIGFNQILSLSEGLKQRIEAAPRHPPLDQRFDSFFDFVYQVRPDRDELEQLILCGAFDSFEPNRRALLWAIPVAYRHAETLRAAEGGLPFIIPTPEPDPNIDDFTIAEKALHERQILGLDIERHLMAFERLRVDRKGGIRANQIQDLAPGTRAFAVGNPTRLRFPPTKSGKRVVFFDLEDETGLLNVTCFDDTYQRYGHAIVCAPYVTVVGEVQDRDGHHAFLAGHVYPFSPSILHAAREGRPLPIKVGDFLVG